MSLFIIAIITGFCTPLQTSINSRLRTDIKEPFLSSGISFLTGSVFLLLFSFITNNLTLFSNKITLLPWWSYLAGLCAMICLTANILLFPKLGSVQTVVLPMVGQIITSVIIDNFGFFDTKIRLLTWARIIGVVAVIIGIIFIVLIPNLKNKSAYSHHSNLVYQLGGIGAGALFAIEAAINGHVGVVLHSPLQATFLTFIISTFLLFILVISRKNLDHLSLIKTRHTPWWAFLGGVLGSISIFLNTWLIPILGNGTAIVLGILGQIILSLLIDSFGWLGSSKRPIELSQILGLIVLIVGATMVEIF